MADTRRVYTVEYFTLLDDTEVEAKPLPIKRLRLAQDKINKALKGDPVLDEDGNPVLDENGEEQTQVSDIALIDAFLDVTELVMQGQPKCAKFLDEDGRELLEDTIDQDTLYAIVKAATGYDFLAVQQRIEELMEKGLTL